jgi:hypothetical protein
MAPRIKPWRAHLVVIHSGGRARFCRLGIFFVLDPLVHDLACRALFERDRQGACARPK